MFLVMIIRLYDKPWQSGHIGVEKAEKKSKSICSTNIEEYLTKKHENIINNLPLFA